MKNYSSKVCQLCGSEDAEQIIRRKYADSMSSDGRHSSRPFSKLLCKDCGLIREGTDFNYESLEKHYTEDYTVNTTPDGDEHIFFRDGVPITRNAAIADEILHVLGKERTDKIKNAFEIGAGKGSLIEQMRKRLPHASFKGCELNKKAATDANLRGVELLTGDESVLDGKYDLIYAITVFEHVPDTVDFLKTVRSHLSENGSLLLMQPMQDIGSYDIFYVDHLHHFHSSHVKALAAKAGLKELVLAKEPWFAGPISTHVFAIAEETEIKVEYIDPKPVLESLKLWEGVFEQLNKKLDSNKEAKVAVYGLREVNNLLFNYGGLSRANVVQVIDDYPERHVNNLYFKPVKRLRDLSDAEIGEIDYSVLAMNVIYYPSVIQACKERGLKYFPIFNEYLQVKH